MNCPACGTPDAPTTDTVKKTREDHRKHRCPCGVKWTSTARIDKGSIQGPECMVKVERLNPLGAEQLLGISRQSEKPGVLSSPIRSGSLFPDLGADPDLPEETLQVLDPARVETRKGRGDAVIYPAEFETLWAGCKGDKGNKHPAFKAWARLKPPTTLTIERWALWMTTDSWSRGFNKHMSTWLNALGWNDLPDPSAFKAKGATNGVQRPVGKSWLEQQNDRAIEEAMKLP